MGCFYSDGLGFFLWRRSEEWLITQTVPSTKHLNNQKAESSVSERARFPSVRQTDRLLFSIHSLSFCLSSTFNNILSVSALLSVMRHFAFGNRGLQFSITGLIDKQCWIYVGSARLCVGSRERKYTAGFFRIHFFSLYALMLLSTTENTLEKKLSVCMKVHKNISLECISVNKAILKNCWNIYVELRVILSE